MHGYAIFRPIMALLSSSPHVCSTYYTPDPPTCTMVYLFLNFTFALSSLVLTAPHSCMSDPDAIADRDASGRYAAIYRSNLMHFVTPYVDEFHLASAFTRTICTSALLHHAACYLQAPRPVSTYRTFKHFISRLYVHMHICTGFVSLLLTAISPNFDQVPAGRYPLQTFHHEGKKSRMDLREHVGSV